MPTDASGPVTTHVGIPTYATSADAPSGLGFNNTMAVIDQLLSGTQALGTLGWGPSSGGATIDTNLYRASAGQLSTDGTLSVGAAALPNSATIGITGHDTGSGGHNALLAIYNTVSGKKAYVYAADTGYAWLGHYGAANALGWDDTGKVYIGSTDTNLYRNGANQLKTDGSLFVGNLAISSGIIASNTNGVQATKKITIYDGAGAVAGYVQLYTG